MCIYDYSNKILAPVSLRACLLEETNNRNNFGLPVTVNMFLFVVTLPWTPDSNNDGFEHVLLMKHSQYFLYLYPK